MRRAIQFAGMTGLVLTLLVPSLAQNTQTGASHIVGSNGPQPQTSASKFGGGANSGASAWGAGQSSFGGARASSATQKSAVEVGEGHGRVSSAEAPAPKRDTRIVGPQTAAVLRTAPKTSTTTSLRVAPQKTSRAEVAGKSGKAEGAGRSAKLGTHVSPIRHGKLNDRSRGSRERNSFEGSSSSPMKQKLVPAPFGVSEDQFGDRKP